MSIETIFVFLCVFAILAYWAHHNRIANTAVKAARNHTQGQGLQFLDQGAVLTKIKPLISEPFRPRLQRVFRFEFSSRGDRRYLGWVTMDGGRVKAVTLQPFTEGSLH